MKIAERPRFSLQRRFDEHFTMAVSWSAWRLLELKLLKTGSHWLRLHGLGDVEIEQPVSDRLPNSGQAAAGRLGGGLRACADNFSPPRHQGTKLKAHRKPSLLVSWW